MHAIKIRGASEHNLKSVSLDLPRDALLVFTGVSGSGKSSLAFDTIYREGQRRFLESLPAYARQFLGGLERPRVESIEGLSPTVSIDQKTVGRSPRSTVGTITEIHDYFRLLFARLGKPHCPACGRAVASQSVEQICDRILLAFRALMVSISAPVVRARKGEFRKRLEELRRDGLRRLVIDGAPVRLADGDLPHLSRQERHTIEVIVDRIVVGVESRSRLAESVEKAIDLAEGLVRVVPAEGDGGVEQGGGKSGDPGEGAGELFSSRFACPGCAIDLPELEPRLFSFNSPHGACPECDGLGVDDRVDPDAVVADPSLPFSRGGLAVMGPGGDLVDDELDTASFRKLAHKHGFSSRSSWGDLSEEARTAVLYGARERDFSFEGLVPALERIVARGAPAWTLPLLHEGPCRVCQGSRLAPMARAVRFRDRTIAQLETMPIGELRDWLSATELAPFEAPIGAPILRELSSRLAYLVDVGLSYLTLLRRADTLAGGEAQRLRLATQVGGRLQGVLYVLDEPSIGLHPHDNGKLLETLRRLRDLGNTVLVVEHDRATMAAADHLVDVGPGAGPRGGEIVAQGGQLALETCPRSVTGLYLRGERVIPIPGRRRLPTARRLELHGVRHNNLKDIDVTIPLGIMVVVTGVSGSGKSSLVNQVLRPALRQKLGARGPRPGKHRSLRGYSNVDKVIVIDQSPIGRSPRSNPATYVKLFDLIRELFAETPEARARGYQAGRFSFNREGGRCLECGGAGVTVIEMQLLAPVEVLCDVCEGRRYNRETLEIRYRGRSIFDVLEMTVHEAAEFFADHPRVHRGLEWLDKVGLGYMRLGQPSTTLSGGEAQRIKLAAELRGRESGRTLYLLDEPTTGLHFEDIRCLLEALQDLVSRGNTVLVIEHNTDVIKAADHVIDLGPGAGEAGGRVVAAGTPEEICRVAESRTGEALREAARGPAPAPQGRALPGPEHEARCLEVVGARQHNLRSVNARIPRDSITVITGVSGSGKTSLALDTLFAEGQRRYVESLSTYARRFLGRIQGAPVDSLSGLSPAIAVDQRSSASNPRSTVATVTEIHDYLRLLYARVGRAHCPECGVPLVSSSPTRLAADLVEKRAGERVYVLAPLAGSFSAGETSSRLSELGAVRSSLLKSGFTRVFACGQELRLDEDGGEGRDPVYRILTALRAADGGPQGLVPPADSTCVPGGGAFAVVVDRLVVGESSRTRLADSLQQAFARGEGWAGVRPVDGPTLFHSQLPSCPRGHFQFREEITPRMFSFSSHRGACERCRGLGTEKRAAPDLVVPRPDRPLVEAIDARLLSFLERHRPSSHAVLLALCAKHGIPLQGVPFKELPEADRAKVLFGLENETVGLRLRGGACLEASWPGLFRTLESWDLSQVSGVHRTALERLLRPQVCSACGGERLRPEILGVRLSSLDRERSCNIQDLCRLTVEGATRFLQHLKLSEREEVIAREVRSELANRLEFLAHVGLGYLTLERSAGTLSGGEAQRIRLASQLGNRLAGVLYVLDEPTVGLHPRDTRELVASLRRLRDQGNTIVVVEHDRDVMLSADWIIDVGPGPGTRGGEIVAAGTPLEVAAHPTSATGRYLRGEAEGFAEHGQGARSPVSWIEIQGACHHNLRDVSVAFPLGVFTAVTGVSGSGKSTLVLDVLAAAVAAYLGRRSFPRGRLSSIRGLEGVRRLVVVDQKPLGRTPRSNPATYTGIWEHVRGLYGSLPLSRVRGWGPGRFSSNSGAGRCAACDGLGARAVEMHFLSDVWVSCSECHGSRFNRETLKVLFKGKSVADVLELEVEEACELFDNQPRVLCLLDALRAVGLGYLKLGQPANTLSGGEAQRVKLARELATQREGGCLYVLDEPTTGLHFEDIRKLLGVLVALVDLGNTVVAVEHQTDVVRAADWVIDLGPEAGENGGEVVVAGPPAAVAACAESRMGPFLSRAVAAAGSP
jgi:excinuclease ABC subunit A